MAAPQPSVITIRTPGLSLPDPGASRETYTRAERVSVATLSLVAAKALRLVSHDRSRHKIVLLDEAWFLLASTQGRLLLNRLVRLGRSMNTTILLATQRLADLGDLSELVGVYFLFGQDSIPEAERALRMVDLDPDDAALRSRLTEYRQGLCLMRDLDGRVGEVQFDLVFPDAAGGARQHAGEPAGMRRRWPAPARGCACSLALPRPARRTRSPARPATSGATSAPRRRSADGLFGRYPLEPLHARPALRRGLGLADRRRRRLRRAADDRLLPRLDPLGADELPGEPADLSLQLRLQPRLVNGSQATGGAGALAPVSQAIHSIYANVFGGPWLVLAVAVVGIWAMWKALVQRRYSETAGALGALADLRRPRAVLRRPARGDDRQPPRSGPTRCRRRSCRSPTTAAPRAAAGEGRRGQPALRPARLQALGRPQLRRARTLRRRRHAAPKTPIPNRLRCGRCPRTRAATPRSPAGWRAGPRSRADGKVCVNNANKYALALPALRPRHRRTQRRVRRA